jgi:predicted ATPase
VEQTYLRAHHLCHHLEEPQQLFPVLRGLWNYYNVRAEMQTAQTLGEQLLTLAQQNQDSAMLVAAHRALGMTAMFFTGGVASAQTHFAQGIALYDPQQHRAAAFLYGEDSGVFCHSFASWTLWCLGYPAQGLARSQEAMILAHESVHLFTRCLTSSAAAIFHAFCREMRLTQEHAEAAISLAQGQGFPYLIAVGSLMHGWALAHQGQGKKGVEQINQALRAFRATGAKAWQPYWLALLADAYGTMAEPEAGLAVLTEALTLIDTTGERWYEADIHRLKGALLLQQHADNQAEAESCFHHALDVARRQEATSLELRAAMSLSRLWQSQGKRTEAYALLAPVYGWFTEGFDTTDLQEAKALLETLA